MRCLTGQYCCAEQHDVSPRRAWHLLFHIQCRSCGHGMSMRCGSERPMCDAIDSVWTCKYGALPHSHRHGSQRGMYS